MRVAVATSYVFHAVKEVHGRDKVIWGGAERYMIEFGRMLRELGHEVTVYQPLPPVPEGVKAREVRKDFYGTEVVLLPVSNDWRYSTNVMFNAAFSEFAGMHDLAVYFATFMCWPYVVHPSISISHGIFWDFPHHAVKSWTEAERQEFFRRQLYGFTAPDVCVAVDSNIRRVIQAMFPGDESRIVVIPNFVDTEKFTPGEKDWDGIRVLCPRRLTAIRGCNDFIKASMKLPQYEWIFCGGAADEDVTDQVAAWAKTTRNVRAVHCLPEEMPDVYRSVDIAVVPTKAAEGLSLSLLESMAAGLLVVTTPVGGLGDAVIDGYNAIVYDPNHDDLADAVRVLAEDEGLRRKFGGRNRKITQECFDIRLWKARWAQILAQF